MIPQGKLDYFWNCTKIFHTDQDVYMYTSCNLILYFIIGLIFCQNASSKLSQSNKLIKLNSPMGHIKQSRQIYIILPNTADLAANIDISTQKNLCKYSNSSKNHQISPIDLRKPSKLSPSAQRSQNSQMHTKYYQFH